MSELDPSARAILDGGRDGDDPTPADRARVRASVMRAIAAGGASAAAATASESAAAATAASTAPLALGWKLFAGFAVIALVGAGLLVARDHAAPSSPTVITTSLPAAPAPPPSAPASLTAASAPSADPAVPLAVIAPSAAVVAPRSSAERSPPIPRVVAPAPSSAELTPPPAAIPPVAAAPVPEAIQPPADTLAAETQRLREAHGALQGGDASRALALLDEQVSAGAQLREERAAARVLALCQLGKVDEARAAAQRFLQESPRSPLADRVRASCAGR